MKLKKILALSLAAVFAFSAIGCGAGSAGTEAAAEPAAEKTVEAETEEVTEEAAEDAAATGELSYAGIELGESYADISTSIKWLTNRTDLNEDGTLAEYISMFNEMYPNITVEVDAMTDYAEESLLRLSSGDWGDVMFIPAVDKNLYESYYVSYGDLDTMESLVRFADQREYGGSVYGIACTGNASGIVYNKAVFEAAGVTTLPATPEEFIAALQAIKDNTDAIPLYTNYAAGWTMGAWDDYIAGGATGSSEYINQDFLHTQDPFKDYGDGTHAYAVYKILYDAVAGGLTEDDYTTTDWEGCKGMINNGEIGCMVLGSWAYAQMVEAGDHGDDIGYMPFPITVDGKRYAGAGPDYTYGININASDDNKAAAMVFVKWMTEKSNFSYDIGGLPIAMDGEYPEVYKAFDGIELISDAPALPGEETYLNELNAESELNIKNSGDSKIQKIIEHAANGDKSFDDIMNEWNQLWSDAQATLGIEVTK